MVKVQKTNRKGSSLWKACAAVLFGGLVFIAMISNSTKTKKLESVRKPKATGDIVQQMQLKKEDPQLQPKKKFYTSMADLTEEERHPRKGSRHMIDPPAGGKLTLVHCDTSAGPWSILVHHKWAPLGAARFLEMVTSKYFDDNQVPLMRCLPNFLCQFGLAGAASKQFGDRLEDDPNWLPEGKEYRENKDGVRRFPTGYMAYAGSGPKSRSMQLIIANHDSKQLAGGSPWEVPWGEIVGKHSFQTLANIYTGYGEKGPGQGKLHKEGHIEWVKKEFPKLDWVTKCAVIDEEIQAEPAAASANNR